MPEYGRGALASVPSGHRERQSAALMSDELSALYRTLLDADDRNDTAALARIAWGLFTTANVACEAWCEAADLLAEMRAASQAAVAGQGSPGSLALLRHVLARHGWLPPPDATPLQVLAAPPRDIRALLRCPWWARSHMTWCAKQMADRRPGRSVAGNPVRPSGVADERHDRFAALVRARRDTILASYAATLEALHSPVIAVPRTRDQAMADASEVIADVAAGVQGRDIRIDDHHETLAWVTGEAEAEGQLRPADLLRAATALFEVTVGSLAAHVNDDPALMPCFARAAVILNESINRRVGAATLAHTSYLLEQVDQAHQDERRRIARDLHDRVGEGMSVAFRQLELHEIMSSEIMSSKDPLKASLRAVTAKEAIAEAMRRLRMVTCDLRHDSVRSLERALIQYIDSVAPDVAAAAHVRLRVSGDETWAPPAVIDEAYLILREAIRNALRHGAPRLLLIGIALAPYELHAWVEDDGCGFAVPERASPVFSGTGLASMRERAALAGGQLTIASAPGQGTHVELLVPLQGHGHE